MSWIETSRRLRSTTPTSDGLARLGAAVGEPVEVVGPLHGGVASSVHHLRTPTRSLVLKRFAAVDRCQREWACLNAIGDVAVPAPQTVAFDPDCTWFDMPALVVTYIEGRAMHPPDPEALGLLLATIHSTPIPDEIPPVLVGPTFLDQWEPGAETLPSGTEAAIAELRTLAANEEPVFGHGDFHPGNVLVNGGSVAGVVDWPEVGVLPAGLDVGFLRVDLAIEPGGDAPERFLHTYQAARGTEIPHLPWWDVLAGARAIECGAGWVDGWTEVGIAMTAERVRTAAVAMVEAALARPELR